MRIRRHALILTLLLSSLPAFAATERHIVLDDCVVGGCSNELCSDAGKEPAISPCIANPANHCYAGLGECKRQVDGKCGWTQTEQLKACIAHPPAEPGTTPPKPVAGPAPAPAPMKAKH